MFYIDRVAFYSTHTLVFVDNDIEPSRWIITPGFIIANCALLLSSMETHCRLFIASAF